MLIGGRIQAHPRDGTPCSCGSGQIDWQRRHPSGDGRCLCSDHLSPLALGGASPRRQSDGGPAGPFDPRCKRTNKWTDAPRPFAHAHAHAHAHPPWPWSMLLLLLILFALALALAHARRPGRRSGYPQEACDAHACGAVRTRCCCCCCCCLLARPRHPR